MSRFFRLAVSMVTWSMFWPCCFPPVLVTASSSSSSSSMPHMLGSSSVSSVRKDDLVVPYNKDNDNSNSLSFLDKFKTKYANEPTFLQSVLEMASSLNNKHIFLHPDPSIAQNYKRIFQILLEPERIISFRVPWMDDGGTLRINIGYRIEFSSALGPYKGGTRFHPSVNQDILKSLAFEQVYKNALTGLSLGGGKGGSDFDPKGKSKAEIQRFCQSFMIELYRYLHPSTDVPAGDIGVGGREIGFMYGQYKRLTNRSDGGVLTGKPLGISGSPLRPEATGYGLIYIAKLAIENRHNSKGNMNDENDYKEKKDLNRHSRGLIHSMISSFTSSSSLSSSSPEPLTSLKEANCAVSGSGNVAQYAADKLLQLGAKVMTMSDSNGTLLFPNGMTRSDWKAIVKAKQVDRLRLSQIEDQVSGHYIDGASPWKLAGLAVAVRTTSVTTVKYDYAFPCATQNELDGSSIKHLIDEGILGIFEGANLPINLDGQRLLKIHSQNVIYIPGKAANAGGVGVSGFEMAQNAQRMTWTSEEVDEKLKELMGHIYRQLVEAAGEEGTLEMGANTAGFLRVVQGMEDLGWV